MSPSLKVYTWPCLRYMLPTPGRSPALRAQKAAHQHICAPHINANHNTVETWAGTVNCWVSSTNTLTKVGKQRCNGGPRPLPEHHTSTKNSQHSHTASSNQCRPTTPRRAAPYVNFRYPSDASCTALAMPPCKPRTPPPCLVPRTRSAPCRPSSKACRRLPLRHARRRVVVVGPPVSRVVHLPLAGGHGRGRHLQEGERQVRGERG